MHNDTIRLVHTKEGRLQLQHLVRVLEGHMETPDYEWQPMPVVDEDGELVAEGATFEGFSLNGRTK